MPAWKSGIEIINHTTRGLNMNNSNDEKKNGQFVLSYELLTLLRWLADHDADKLKKIIGKALNAGLYEEIQKIDTLDEMTLLDSVHNGITDFLEITESLLIEVMSEHVKQKAKYQDLLPAIDHIDTTVCDDTTVRFSIEKATSKMETNPEANPKEMLFKELLKRWKPSDKNVKN